MLLPLQRSAAAGSIFLLQNHLRLLHKAMTSISACIRVSELESEDEPLSASGRFVIPIFAAPPAIQFPIVENVGDFLNTDLFSAIDAAADMEVLPKPKRPLDRAPSLFGAANLFSDPVAKLLGLAARAAREKRRAMC
jgi:hypothetical protein